jgi:TonB family protein
MIMQNASILILVFAAVGFFVTPKTAAQIKTCNLKLKVATTDQDHLTARVNDAQAVALNTVNDKRFDAVLHEGQPWFTALARGPYRISVTKLGFKRAVQPIIFRCAQMNAETSLHIDLIPGSVKLSVIARSKSINAQTPGGVLTVTGSAPLVQMIKNSAGKYEVPKGTPRGTGTVTGPDPSAPVIKSGAAKDEPPLALARGPIQGGVLNGKALVLPPPVYPAIARSAHASGTVVVQVVIDEEGDVESAHAVSGHPLLQAVCVQAARNSKFSPTKLEGQPVKVTGVITYNFVAQ